MNINIPDNINEFGHILVYGPTYSGKTQLTKDIIKFLNPVKVIVFTRTNDDWQNVNNVLLFNDFIDNEVQTIVNKCLQYKQNEFNNMSYPFVFVFDDFNEALVMFEKIQLKEDKMIKVYKQP